MIWLPLAAMFMWVEKMFLGERFETSTKAGFGATPYVWLRQIQAPMSDRVLMAWLNKFSGILYTKITGKPFIWRSAEHVKIYLFWKWVFVALPLVMMHYMFGFSAACFLALAWALVWQHEYWCVYVEALCFLLVLTASLPLALLAAVLGGLSRESVFLIVPMYVFVTGDYLGGIGIAAVFALTYWLKRRWVGERTRYVHTFALWSNLVWGWWLKRMKQVKHGSMGYMPYGVFWILLAVAVAWMPMPLVLTQTAGCMLVLVLFSGPLWGFLWEPRTIVNAAIWIGPALIGVWG